MNPKYVDQKFPDNVPMFLLGILIGGLTGLIISLKDASTLFIVPVLIVLFGVFFLLRVIIEFEFVFAFLVVFTPLYLKIPLFNIPGSATPIRMEDFIFGSILILWLLWLSLGEREKPRKKTLNIGISIYIIVTLISTVLGMFLNKTVTLLGGFFYFSRTLEYILIFYITFSVFKVSKLRYYLKLIFATGSIVVLVGIFQQMGLLNNLSFWMLNGKIISTPTESSTFSASYDFGAYLLVIAILMYVLLFVSESAGGFSKKIMLPLFALTFWMLLNSQARSSVAAFFVIITLFSVTQLVIQKDAKSFGFLLSASVLFPFLSVSSKVKNMFGALDFDSNSVRGLIAADPSGLMRLHNWGTVLARWKQHPFFGNGLSSLFDLPTTPDGWYIRLLGEVGLIGLLAFLCLMFIIIRFEWKLYRQTQSPLQKYFVLGVLLGTIGLLLNAILIDIFAAIKISVYFWMLTAMAVKIGEKQEKIEKITDSKGVSN